jgi:hypothetical protein
MRRVVIVLATFGMLWLAPVPAASATAATALYPALFDDLGSHVAGRPVDVSAVLLTGADDAPVAGQSLTVSVRQYGTSTFTTVGSATTGPEGVATTLVTLDRNAVVRWDYAGDPTYAASSTEYLVPISPRVDLRVNHRKLHKGQRLVARGRTYPAKAGCRVKLWRGELRPLVQGPRPQRLAVSTVRSDGTYRLAHRFRKKARMRVAVTVAPCAGNDRGLSSYVRIRIR